MRYRRQAEIVERLRSDGATSVQTLAASFGVSPTTIRRDLRQLGSAGGLRRVHGGALVEAAGTVEEPVPFARVATVDAADKESVARCAAGLVAEGDVILLDIGTTTLALARALRGRRLTVLTASLAVVDVLRDDTAVELLVLGGVLRRAYHCLAGALTEEALLQVRADRAFLGASGVRPDGQVLDTTVIEVPVKRAMMAAAREVVLLADRHKFPGTGALRVCGTDEVDVLVTNAGADPVTLERCTAGGTRVLRA